MPTGFNAFLEPPCMCWLRLGIHCKKTVYPTCTYVGFSTSTCMLLKTRKIWKRPFSWWLLFLKIHLGMHEFTENLTEYGGLRRIWHLKDHFIGFFRWEHRLMVIDSGIFDFVLSQYHSFYEYLTIKCIKKIVEEHFLNFNNHIYIYIYIYINFTLFA